MVGPSQVRPGSNSSQPGQIPVSRPVKWGVRGRSPLRPDRLAGPFTHQHPCMRIQMSTASPLHWARGAIKGEQTPINGRPASGHGVFADSLSLDCSIGRVRLKNSKNSYPRVPGVTILLLLLRHHTCTAPAHLGPVPHFQIFARKFARAEGC